MSVRAIEPRDLMGVPIQCPHCNQILKVTAVEGPYIGWNPELQALDRAFILTLEDGEQARFWCDNKGIVEGPVS